MLAAVVCTERRGPGPDAGGSRAPLAVLPGLILNDASGRPTTAAEAVLREGATLVLGRIA